MNEGERIHYQIVWIGTGEWSETEGEVLLIVSQEVRKERASTRYKYKRTKVSRD